MHKNHEFKGKLHNWSLWYVHMYVRMYVYVIYLHMYVYVIYVHMYVYVIYVHMYVWGTTYCNDRLSLSDTKQRLDPE